MDFPQPGFDSRLRAYVFDFRCVTFGSNHINQDLNCAIRRPGVYFIQSNIIFALTRHSKVKNNYPFTECYLNSNNLSINLYTEFNLINWSIFFLKSLSFEISKPDEALLAREPIQSIVLPPRVKHKLVIKFTYEVPEVCDQLGLENDIQIPEEDLLRGIDPLDNRSTPPKLANAAITIESNEDLYKVVKLCDLNTKISLTLYLNLDEYLHLCAHRWPTLLRKHTG